MEVYAGTVLPNVIFFGGVDMKVVIPCTRASVI